MIEPDPTPRRFRTLYQDAPIDSRGGGLSVLSELTPWHLVWRGLHHGSGPAPAPPPVDRSRETVILLGAGAKPSFPGYEVRITDVAVQGATLVVTATETRPPGGGWMDAVCSPIHVVAADIPPGILEDMRLHLHVTSTHD